MDWKKGIFFEIDTVYCLLIDEREELKIRVQLFKKQKNEIIKIEKERVKNQFAKEAIVLSINSSKIISKSFSDEKELVEFQKNIPENTFYFQKVLRNDLIELTFIRKSDLDEIIITNNFDSANILGIDLSGTILRIYENEINEQDSQFLFYEELVSTEDLLFHVLAFEFFVFESQNLIQPKESKTLKEEVLYHKNFRQLLTKAVPALLITIFLALFLTYFLERSKSSKNQISVKYFELKQQKEMLIKSTKDLNNKRDSLLNAPLIPVSIISDLIGRSKPRGIFIESMNIYPIHKSSGKVKIHDPKTVFIKARSHELTQIEFWISKLKKDTLIEEVWLENLTNVNKSGQSDFELKLKSI